MRRLLMAGLLALCCSSLCLITGCELAFEGVAESAGAAGVAGAEVAGAEVAGAEVAGAEVAAGGEEAAGVRGAGLGEAGAARGARAASTRTMAHASESLAAEPYEGEVEHFDLNHNKIGRTEIQAGRARHFNASGREVGHSIRHQWGSQVFDDTPKQISSTRVEGNISRAIDSERNLQGYSRRVGNRAYSYDAKGRYNSYSVIRPIRSASAPGVPVIPPPVVHSCPQGYHLVRTRWAILLHPRCSALLQPRQVLLGLRGSATKLRIAEE